MIQNLFRHKAKIFCFILILITSFSMFSQGDEYPEKTEPPAAQTDQEAWTGIDVSIVGKYAEKYGRPPRDPYINTDQGDLLLFVFTVAGVLGGFVIGFNVRKLFYEK